MSVSSPATLCSAQKLSEAGCVEIVKCSGVPLVDGPLFTAIQQYSEDHCAVDLEVTPFCSTRFCSLPKAMLALANLAFTSSSITTFLERVLPRYMNLFTRPTLSR